MKVLNVKVNIPSTFAPPQLGKDTFKKNDRFISGDHPEPMGLGHYTVVDDGSKLYKSNTEIVEWIKRK